MDEKRAARVAESADNGSSSQRQGRRMRPAAAVERWVALFLLALLLFSPPFLSIFSGHRLLSVPVIYVYLFLAWGLVIVLLALAAEGGFPKAQAGPSAPADEPPAGTEGED